MVVRQKLVLFFLWVLLIDLSLFADDRPTILEYSISPATESDQPALKIELGFQGNRSGMTYVFLPSSWGGQDALYLEISELCCASSHVTIEDTDRPDMKRVCHRPNEYLQLSYFVSSIQKREEYWYFRPLVEHEYFFFVGCGVFIVPNVSNHEKVEVLLEWREFPADWELANSFGVCKKTQKVSSLYALKQGVYVGGDFRLIPCGSQDAPIFVAIRGEWSFSDQRLTDLLETIAASQCQFWNDRFPYYLVTWLPIGKRGSLEFRFTGTCLHNSYAAFMEGDLSDEQEEAWKVLTGLLGHEHFHSWLGVKMRPQVAEERLLTWFVEGFTEYYGHLINYRSHLMSSDDYIEQMNHILYEYYTSSVRNEKNERIIQDFWRDKEVQRLPYLRGFLFALHWDKRIRERSCGRYCLDDFMRVLFKKARRNKQLFSQEDIETVASRFLPFKNVQEDLNKYIMNGELLIPPETDIDGMGCLEWVEDLGFLLQETSTGMKIVKIREGNRAFQAGLRAGYRVLHYQCVDRVVSVCFVNGDGQTREVTYSLDPVEKFFPRYRLTTNLEELAS